MPVAQKASLFCFISVSELIHFLKFAANPLHPKAAEMRQTKCKDRSDHQIVRTVTTLREDGAPWGVDEKRTDW